MAERERRRGRGRLSQLDMLPDVAQPDLQWLKHELREARRPQLELLDVFNARLAAHGIAPISKSSFSRFSVRKAVEFREIDDTLRLATELAQGLGLDGADKLTITLAQMLNVHGIKLLEAEGSKLAAKDLMELGRAMQAATSAQKQSTDLRRLLKREFDEERAKAAKDVAAIGKAAGVSDETMAKINRRLMGGA